MAEHQPWRAHALRLAILLAVSIPYPCRAVAQSAPTPPLDAPAVAAPLVPPRLLETTSSPLLELPADSAPGSVVLELTVSREGQSRDPLVLVSGGEQLDQRALAASTALRFAPAMRGAEAIEARIPFRFDFRPKVPEIAPAVSVTAPALPLAAEPLVGGVTLEVQGQRPPRETTVHALEVTETQKLPGTNGDPIRAIEALPGVARPPAVEGMLIVRGSAPSDSAIFIDGIQIPIAYHFGGISSVVPNDSLAQLEFRPGNFGAEYGRAMGGVIELGLRSPRRDRIGGVLQLDAIDGRLMVEGPLGSRTRFMLGARRSWVDAWIGRIDDDIASAPVYYDGQAVIEHDFSARTKARLFFFGADDRLKLLFDAPDASDPSESGRLSLGTRFTRLVLRIDSELSDALQYRQTLSWGTDTFGFKEGQQSQQIDAHSIDARAELRARLASFTSLAVGVDLQLAKYHVVLRVPPFGTTDEFESPDFARPLNTFDERVWLLRPAAYALLEITPMPGFRIVPSVRADYTRDTNKFTIDPRLSLRADLHPGFPRTTLKAGAGSYSQPPQPVESVEPFGSKGVGSNRSLHFSAGVEQELARGLELSLEGFYKRLSKLVIASTAEQEGIGARFRNSGDGHAYGGEALLRYRDARGRFFGWIAYTLSRSERRDRRGEPLHPFAYDQTHILTALGNFELGRGFSLGGRFRYVTGSPYTPLIGGVLDLDAGVYAPVPGAPYGGRLPAFHQLDVRVDKSFQVGPAKLVVYLELRNAYNRENAELLSYRFDYAKSKPVSGLPILPVIGLRGEL